MFRQGILAMVGCGLIACANGTESGTKTTETKQSSSPAPQPVVTSTSAQQGPGRLPADTVVASWDGGQLTYGDLVAEKAGDFRRLRNKYQTDLYNLERQSIDQKVIEMFLKKAAAEKGQSEKEYLDAQAGDVEVTDAEVKQFHASNPRLANQPFEPLAPRIKAFLTQQKRQETMAQVFEKLKADNGMKLMLPRADIETAKFDLSGRPSKGKPDAKVTIVEFSDFECPFCARAVSGVEAIVSAYPNDVKIVFMHFPLNMHRNAMPTAIAAQCANLQGKFWPFHDAVFAAPQQLSAAKLQAHAQNVGLDMEEYQACIKDPVTQEFVRKDMAQGMEAGVGGTPAFYINGEPFPGGVPTPADIKRYIEG